MNDILLIAGREEHDDELVATAIAHHARRVTVLIEAPAHLRAVDEASEERARGDRLATLISAVELATGAIVVGLVGSPALLDTSGFDAVVGAPGLATAA